MLPGFTDLDTHGLKVGQLQSRWEEGGGSADTLDQDIPQFNVLSFPAVLEETGL